MLRSRIDDTQRPLPPADGVVHTPKVCTRRQGTAFGLFCVHLEAPLVKQVPQGVPKQHSWSIDAQVGDW